MKRKEELKLLISYGHMQKYSLCFTIPCNERDKIIVVLLDPVAKNINGELQYPLNILKMPKAK